MVGIKNANDQTKVTNKLTTIKSATATTKKRESQSKMLIEETN